MTDVFATGAMNDDLGEGEDVVDGLEDDGMEDDGGSSSPNSSQSILSSLST